MKKNYLKLSLIGVVIFFLIGGAVLFIQNNRLQKENPQQSQQKKQETNTSWGVNIGDQAPKFNLSNLAGEEVKLADFKGKYVLVNFWATWCPPCRAEMPDLNEFHQINKEKFVVLGINLGEDPDKVKSFIQQEGYQYPIVLDQTREVGLEYQVSGIPTSYVVGPQGNIRYFKQGLITKIELDDIKEELMTE